MLEYFEKMNARLLLVSDLEVVLLDFHLKMKTLLLFISCSKPIGCYFLQKTPKVIFFKNRFAETLHKSVIK